MRRYKILYIVPGPNPPEKDPTLSKFNIISEYSEGEVLCPTWWESKHQANEYYNLSDGEAFKIKNFTFRFCYLSKYPMALWFVFRFIFFMKEGIRLSYKRKKFDVIMTYGSNSTGISGLILKFITGSKLILEVPGVPEDGSLFDTKSPTYPARIKLAISNILLKVCLLKTDIVKLLYTTQLDKFPTSNSMKKSVFHDFVPTVKASQHETIDGNYLILIGHPWYRKGIDVLIKAFDEVEKELPWLNLVIVGWHPNRNEFEDLIKIKDRVKILPPQSQEEIFSLISQSMCLALPSRSEAMGRVLLEAMSQGKPILASNVNGIPTYVQHEFNGLLSDPGNYHQLANNIVRIATNKELRIKLGKNGKSFLNSELNEEAYQRKFYNMLCELENKN